MSSPEDELRRHVEQSTGVTLTDASASRVLVARVAASEALHALTPQSLFDTEPEKLHSVLESLADGDDS
ncbi:MAG: hypothetical protein ACI9DC_001160 [Gammaproteobacteria bacterium]|jgi:hypothetical protein